ncbi:MAG: TIGR02253 family HAD-type hydrolase [archaeon]|nr:TIGR02253 family HAD-type hydrolase [archaeon]
MRKTVFFDIDDTLLDTSGFAEIARRSAIEAMCDNGLPLEYDEAYDMLKEIIKEKGSNYGKHFNILTKRLLGQEDSFLIALGMTTYHNIKFSLLRPFPRTLAILIYLKTKGYHLGAITNGKNIKQWEKLVRLNIHHFFDIVITSEEVGVEKPDPIIYLEALRRMNCDPKNSIMVGNKLDVDCVGAVNAGMSAILVNSTLSEEEKERVNNEKIPIIVLDNISDIDTIL